MNLNYILIFIGLLAIGSSCNNSSKPNYCVDSCRNLVLDAVRHYEENDYKYVIQLPDSFACCDTSFIKSMLWWKALAYRDLQQHHSAIWSLTRLIRLDPGFTDAYAKRGNSYQLIGRKNEALADYNIALELNPVLATERNNRARIYMEQGELNKALDDYNYILQINPKDSNALYNRGIVYAMKKKYHLSIRDLNLALALDTNANLLYTLAGAEYESHNYKDALAHIEHAIFLNPDILEHYLLRAYINLKLQNTEATCTDVKWLGTMGYMTEDTVLLEACKLRF